MSGWLRHFRRQPAQPPRPSTVTPPPTSPPSTATPPESQNSDQSARPPFRPAGTAPVQGPSSKPSSPSRGGTQSQALRPPTPSRSSPSRKSPSRLAPRTEGETSPTLTTAKKKPPPSVSSDNVNQAALEITPQLVKEAVDEAAILQLPAMTTHPSKESDIRVKNQESKAEEAVLETKDQETKPSVESKVEEEKEALLESRGEDHLGYEAKQEIKEMETTKEKQEPENEQKDKQEESSSKKQTEKASKSNGQQTKGAVTDSHKKPPISREEVDLHKDLQKKLSLEEGPVKVITLAGDNRGASMQLGLDSSKKEQPIHIHRAYKSKPAESVAPTTDTEGRKSEDQKTPKDQEVVIVYVNSNVQGANNSILVDSSIKERNPGVNLEIPCSPAEPVKPNDKTAPVETRKGEKHTIVHAQKLAYEQQQYTVRRRCLEGLFREPSDSDPENPEKPRRHGCRVGCKDKGAGK